MLSRKSVNRRAAGGWGKKINGYSLLGLSNPSAVRSLKMPRRSATAADSAAQITPGVFFGASVALPRGPQALPRADVLAAQRERLMAAMAELLAEAGYAQVKIGTLASRAKLSRPAFYE